MTYPYVGPVAHSSGTDNLPINRVVIHCTAGSDAKGATGTAKYFQQASATGSAHYVTDPNQTVQCAYDTVVCWHAPPNQHSLGIEICCSLANDGKGHWQLASHITMMQHAATLTAEKCIQYKIPAVKLTPADLVAGQRGVCGHVDVTNAFHKSTHTDPGPYFPWQQFMGMVQSEITRLTAPSKPPAKPPVTPPATEAEMTLDEFESYLKRFYSDGGTGGVYHQQEVDYRAAVLDAIKAQTDAITALAAALAPKA